MIAIWKASLDIFLSEAYLTVRGNLIMLRNMFMIAKEDLCLEDWFPSLGPYPLKDEMGMVVTCVTLSFSLRKGIFFGHLP